MAVNNFVFCFLTTLFFVVSISDVQSILPPSYTINASEAPFMCYVRNRYHYCGGVILNEHIVLTARHCITEPQYMTISAGRSNKYYDSNDQTLAVQKTLPHENYRLDQNGIQAYFDIGLLLLQTPFNFNQHVQPISWTKNIDFDKESILYGWGSTDAFRNSPSYNLRAKNISLITDVACIEMLSKAKTKCTKQDYEVCAEKSACNGDSGSPITQKVDNVTTLIGVVSWVADDNINCDSAPAVFENVGYFSEWIKDGMRALLKINVTESQEDNENKVHLH